MNTAQHRIIVGVMLALAVMGWSWSFDQRKRSEQLVETLASVISQQEQLAHLRSPTEARVRNQQAGQSADKERVLRVAAGFGSDARNLAEALGRMKTLCLAAGLAECQVRRSISAGTSAVAQLLEPKSGSGAVAGSSATTRLPRTERLLGAYPVSMLATFNPKGLVDFLHRLRSLDMLYRLDRILIAQNRMELDVVFLHSSEVRLGEQPLVQRPNSHAEVAVR